MLSEVMLNGSGNGEFLHQFIQHYYNYSMWCMCSTLLHVYSWLVVVCARAATLLLKFHAVARSTVQVLLQLQHSKHAHECANSQACVLREYNCSGDSNDKLSLCVLSEQSVYALQLTVQHYTAVVRTIHS
jgi:hypothetical protein